MLWKEERSFGGKTAIVVARELIVFVCV
jgi:hypothetical protein